MITFNEPIVQKEEKKLLNEAISSSSVAQGPYVEKFESLFASYCGSRYGAASFNGTVALHLALLALGIKENDEVIVPSFTFVGTANAAAFIKAKPVFADIKKDTLCIDPESIKEKITKRTKAIIPVHVYGNVCDMENINDIAKKHGVYVVEDSAEAHGARYKGKKTGTLSDIGCFSFHSSKILKTGEGGMCTTNNAEFDHRMKILRSQGKVKNEQLKGDEFIEKRYYHQMLGFNYRMLDLQAAIGIAQLKKIEPNIVHRRKIAGIYEKELSKRNVDVMEKEQNSSPVYWVYPVIFKDKKTKLKVGRELMKKNIPFLSSFWPCHKQPFYSSKEGLPIAEDISERLIALPCNTSITKREAVWLAGFIGKIIKNA